MKRTLICMLSALAMCCLLSCDDSTEKVEVPTSVWDGETYTYDWYTKVAKVDGTTAYSYTLSSASDFAGFMKLVNEGATVDGTTTLEADDFDEDTITLAVNIDLNNKSWTPIGQAKKNSKTYAPVQTDGTATAFKGTFNGNNLTISNLAITRSDATEESKECIGLFGIVDGGAISNLIVKDASVEAPNYSVVGTVAGMLVGNSTMKNISVTGTSSMKSMEGGGLAGIMTIEGTIDSCVNYATVETTGNGAGGIIAKAYYSAEGKTTTITNCKNYGEIKATKGGYTGGIAGLAAAEITACKNYGNVSGIGTSIGGIVGEFTNYGFVKDSTNDGDITGSSGSGVGGIVGWIRYQDDTSSYPTAKNSYIEVSSNTNNGSISSSGLGSGGIVGLVYYTAKVNNNINNAPSIKGRTFVSGIVGGHQAIASGESEGTTTFNTDEDVEATEIQYNKSTTKETNITGNDCLNTIVYLNDGRVTKTEGNDPAIQKITNT